MLQIITKLTEVIKNNPTHILILKNQKMSKAVSLYSTWWVKPGKEKSLVRPLQKLAKDVLANEKGTLMYTVHSPRYDFPKKTRGKDQIISEPMMRPGTLVFVEKYANWDAFKKHLYGKYFKEFVAKHKNKFVLTDEKKPFVQVVFMDEIVGFPNK